MTAITKNDRHISTNHYACESNHYPTIHDLRIWTGDPIGEVHDVERYNNLSKIVH